MGYATSMMKETGRAMRLDINHRRSKILTLSKGTSASALSRKYVRTYKNLSPSPLTGPSSLEMLKHRGNTHLPLLATVPIIALASSVHDTHTVSNKSEPPERRREPGFFSTAINIQSVTNDLYPRF